MGKIAWITDSTSGLTPEKAKELGIHVVPLHVTVGGQEYKDGIEITNGEFYSRILQGEAAKTSQPSIGDFMKLYEELKERGYEKGIAVHVSSNLSGTLQTSKMAAESCDFPLEVIDSHITSYPMLQIVLDGIEFEKQGKSYDDIVTLLREYPNRVHAYLLLDNLEFLHRGGRMNAAQFLIGNLLQIKPILSFDNGNVVVFAKVRTYKKSKTRIFELLADYIGDIAHLCVVHSSALDEAMIWKKEIEELYPGFHVDIAELGPVLGVHAGPGLIGLAWTK